MSSKRHSSVPQRDSDAEVQEELRQELVREMLALQAQRQQLEAEQRRLLQEQSILNDEGKEAREDGTGGDGETDGLSAEDRAALAAMGVNSLEELAELRSMLDELKTLTAERDRLVLLSQQLDQEKATASAPAPVPAPAPRPAEEPEETEESLDQGEQLALLQHLLEQQRQLEEYKQMLVMLEQLKAAQDVQAAAGLPRVEEVPEEVEEELEGREDGEGEAEVTGDDEGFGLTQEEWDAMSPVEQQRVQELMTALSQRQAELATVREEQAKLHAQAQELRAAVTAPVVGNGTRSQADDDEDASDPSAPSEDDPVAMQAYLISLMSQLTELKGMLAEAEAAQAAAEADAAQQDTVLQQTADTAAQARQNAPQLRDDDENDEGDDGGAVDPAILQSLMQLRQLEDNNRRLEAMRAAVDDKPSDPEPSRDENETTVEEDLAEQARLQAQLEVMMQQLQSLKEQGAVLMKLKEDLEGQVTQNTDSAAVSAPIEARPPVAPLQATEEPETEYPEDFHVDGNDQDDEAVRRQLAELQEVRDRVALLRQWLETGGTNGTQSSELDRVLLETAAQCGSDEPRFMEILTEKLFGDLSITAELKQRAGIDATAEAQPTSSVPSASGSDSPGSPSGRPKTSRRVRNPTPSEFNDYVTPSPQRQLGGHVSQTMSFEPQKGVVKSAPDFRSNRPEPLENHADESPDSGEHGRPKTSRKVPHPSPSEFTDYVRPTPKPELHGIVAPSSVVERAVFEETPVESSPIIANDVAPGQGSRSPVRGDSSRELVLQRLGALIDRSPGAVDFLLEFVSLLGGTDVLSGDAVDSTLIPASDPLFRLRLLATVKQLVIDWTIGAPAPLPPVSQPQKGNNGTPSRQEPNYFQQRTLVRPHDSPNKPLGPQLQQQRAHVMSSLVAAPLQSVPVAVEDAAACDYEEVVDDKTVSTLVTKPSMQSITSMPEDDDDQGIESGFFSPMSDVQDGLGDGMKVADIETRLDRALDEEMVKRTRESAQQMAVNKPIRRVVAGPRRRQKRPVKRAYHNDGDESDPSYRRSEASWSFASRGEPASRHDDGDEGSLGSWESAHEQDDDAPLMPSAPSPVKPPMSPVQATPSRPVTIQDSIDSVESREASQALNSTLQYLRELRLSLKASKVTSQGGASAEEISQAVSALLHRSPPGPKQ